VTAGTPGRFHLVTPSYRPGGGVVKLFDYLTHALEFGYEADVHCPIALGWEEPLFSIPRFSRLRTDPRVRFHRGLSVGLNPRDWVMFSWPEHYEQLARGIGPETPHERIIHLVQGKRHADPRFLRGYALRLLARPVARIMVSHEVMSACAPHLNPHSARVTIVEGHDWPFFYRAREGGLGDPIHVGYTTWKSEVGPKVEQALRDRGGGERFVFHALRGTASWRQVRSLLHVSDVFLCFPLAEEGFYLPGLEAMAAGAVVVTPDVGGNRAYCRFGENCLRVGHDDADDYVEALTRLAHASPELVSSLRARGYETVKRHGLERESAAFGRFLRDVSAPSRAHAA
jgi:glycosyltransferase involved in cell wall biosynthesis